MGLDELGFVAVVVLALAMVFGVLLNPGRAVRHGMSAQRAVGRAERHAELILAACAAIPWIAVCSVYSLAVRAAFALGHWPRPMLDDPKAFGWPGHHGMSFILWGVASLAVYGVIALLVVAASRDLRPSRAKGALLCFAIGYGLFRLLDAADPGLVIEWLHD